MNGRTINLTLHGVGEPARPLDTGEKEFWLSVRELELTLQIVLGQQDMKVTVDDSNASDLTIVLPRLMRAGLKATFFVLAGRLGERGYLTPTDVKTLAEDGMSIGSHGWAHRSWRGLSADGVQQEMREARARLEDVVHAPVVETSIPFGAYDRRVLRNLKASGWRRVYSSDGGPARSDSWLQPRNTLQTGVNSGSLQRLLASRQSLPSAAFRSGKMLLKRWR